MVRISMHARQEMIRSRDRGGLVVVGYNIRKDKNSLIWVVVNTASKSAGNFKKKKINIEDGLHFLSGILPLQISRQNKHYK